MMIGQPKGIPFLRVFPDYTVRMQMIERPAEIDVLACAFLAAGGRYMIAIISDNEVRLTAVVEGIGDDVHEIHSEVSPNGVMLPLAVDRLIKESVRKISAVQ